MMFNRMPKYNVNDIVIVEGMSYGSGEYFGHVVGVIKDVINHRDTGDVFYHIIFNSGTPRKVFEYEIENKFNTDKFRNGYLIHRTLLASKIYRTKDYKFLTEGEFIEWVNENFEEKDNIDYTRAYYNYRYDPNKYMYGMYPVKSSLKDIVERINIDDAIKKEINNMVNNVNKCFGVPEFVKRKKFTEMFEKEIKGLVSYKKIIFNGPCTIILWADSTKTIAKLYEDIDKFDPEKGVAICFMKKLLGHTETNKILRKATKQYAEDREEGNGDLIEKIKEALTPMNEYLNRDISSVIKEVKQVEDEERAKEAVKHTPDAIKYRLYTGEEIKVSTDKNISEIFFDDTKEVIEDGNDDC